MKFELEVCSVCWIKANPNTLTSPAAQAGMLSPDWIPKVVIGLVATRNQPPPPIITNFENFSLGTDHRSLIYCKLLIEMNGDSSKIFKVELKKEIISKGYTPPFKSSELNSTVMDIIATIEPSMKDPIPQPGETSAISKIALMKSHPNSSLPNPSAGHTIVVNGLVKFRAGKHTDVIGIEKAGSPYHVPWVWSEFRVTYDGKNFCLDCNGSVFPTHLFYLNKKRVVEIEEVSDTFFPLDGLRTIVAKSLRIWPVLSTGVPVPGSQVLRSEVPPGPIDGHKYTAPAAGHRTYKEKYDLISRQISR